MKHLSFLISFCFLILQSQSQVVWNFGTTVGSAAASANVTNITASIATQQNNNGTTTFLANTTPLSTGYTGASGQFYGALAAKTGAINTSTSTYVEVTLIPATGYNITVTALKWGNNSTTAGGPTSFSVYSSYNNYSTPITTATTTQSNTAWTLISPALTTFTGPVNGAITFRIYGFNGAGTATVNTINWRVDDVQITATANLGATVSNFSSGNLPPLFTTSVATPTTTPALAFALNTQAPNTFLAGPTVAPNAAPTFRALIANDLPSHLHALSTLTDVTLTGSTDGQILKYNAATSKWINTTNTFTETDPSVPTHVKAITTTDISNWNGKENLLTFNNGLTRTANNIGLGGSLVQNTSVNVPTNNYLQIVTNNTNASGGTDGNSKIHLGANYTSHYGTTAQNWGLVNIYENYVTNGNNPSFLSMSTPNIGAANGFMFYNFGDNNSVYPRMITKSNYFAYSSHIGYEHVLNVTDQNVPAWNYGYLLRVLKNDNPANFYANPAQATQFTNLFTVMNGPGNSVKLNLAANGQLKLPFYLNDVNESQVLTTDVNGNLKLKTFTLGGGTGFTGAVNGLSPIGSNVQLGGSLDHSTVIDLLNNNFTLKNGSSSVLSAISTGNVGIGTDATSKTLIVRKDVLQGLGATVELLNGGATNFPPSNTDASALTGSVNIDLNPYFNNTINGTVSQIKSLGAADFSAHLIFSTKNVGQSDNTLVERMRISSNGNVAIGTDDPKNYKLAVAGPMIAEKVVVKLQPNWPDYVFENEYKLMPLEKLREYIYTHKHLPNINSAKEMTNKNGVDIGEMQTKLLEKIEELTLYLLQKEEEIKKQNERILKLESKIYKKK